MPYKDPAKNDAAKRLYAKNNPEKCRSAIQRWREANKERTARTNAAWRKRNRSRVKRQNALYREENYEKMRAASERWRKANPGKVNARTARRTAAKLQATPPWVDLNEVAKFYEEAARLSRETGIPHEVDHIYPLRGKNSCGLHVPWNLQVVTQQFNRAKGNHEPA